jgi:hypothetical protein
LGRGDGPALIEDFPDDVCVVANSQSVDFGRVLSALETRPFSFIMRQHRKGGSAMAYGGIIHFECPKCKGDIEKPVEECLEPQTFVHQACGTPLQYDPANIGFPLVILQEQQ